ncbi:hypothetical protein NPX13_g3149 [Xylaria arbuscula]|uniref:Inhibitor I9 domain-containing protein n=1 Tax=Xylaria arbuscula TaxID=114810 RepID=A0A9W8TPM4_9PEZI|nr:hypothetical protein NPX13_g3149 [Xylaria arbuscula]
MRLMTIAAVALAAAQGAFAVDIYKNIIMTFPESTPDSIVSEAMDHIRDAGGSITHVYKILKGFAAKAPQGAIETVTTMSTKYNAVIEEDQEISITN